MEDRPIKVLLIEDNPGDARLIREFLYEAGSGYELEHVETLSSGIERLEKGNLDIVLLDLRLPDSQGLNTLYSLHEKASTVPIIVFTAIADITIGVRAIQEGAQDYLVKGQIDSNLLVRTIRYAIERKRAEKALQESEKKFRLLSQEFHALLDIIPDSLTLISPDLKILWANKGAADGFGIEVIDLVDQYCFKLWQDSSTPCRSCPVKESFQTGKSSKEEIRTQDGRIWELRTVPIFDEMGNVTNVVEVGRNITECKQAAKVKHENMRLTLAAKAKSDFLANMSHELRTPLNSIIGFSELMKHNLKEDLNENHKRYVDNILTSGHHLLRLINNILEISSAEAGKIELEHEMISVSEIIDETLLLIKEKASRNNILIEIDLDPELDFIEADKLRMKQILFNLISNAVKFNKSDGGGIVISTKKEGDMARFSISDTGVGIKEKDMDRLFKEFEQLDAGITRKYGGTGLGLAISKKLVELQDGKIWAESRYDAGSTFTFILPVVAKNRRN